MRLQQASRINNSPIALGQNASMTILHADGGSHSSPNENSIVVRLDLGATRVLLMGDAEAGGRQSPAVPPSPSSIEGRLNDLLCGEPAAQVLVVTTAEAGPRHGARFWTQSGHPSSRSRASDAWRRRPSPRC